MEEKEIAMDRRRGLEGGGKGLEVVERGGDGKESREKGVPRGLN